MAGIAWGFIWLFAFGVLAYHKLSRFWINCTISIGFILTLTLVKVIWPFFVFLSVILAPILLLLNLPKLRERYFTSSILKQFQNNIPQLSETEKISIAFNTPWWDRELFSGNPKWNELLKTPIPKLSNEEQAFLQGPVETLCRMIDEWDIYNRQDLSPKLWRYLKTEGFFALTIPKAYKGLEFSALAHSEILAKIASKSITVASTVAMPNSVGPIQLLLKYGTDKQKQYYLPKFAEGIEIPCFALSGPEAGSDATAIPDTGIVCRGIFQGKSIIGIRLDWDKHAISLAPIATVLGLTFKLYDPEHLLGQREELGITCALIPTNLPGIQIGQRHRPLAAPFQSGPTQGEDVFIPLDWIIGGPSMAGQGWRMLVECLASSRTISLPSAAAGMAKTLSFATGAYARIRKQFKKPISYFEGIEEVLARMAGYTYIAEATRIMAAASIDRGESLSVLGAIVKYHLTERARKITSDAMDVHAGKGVMLGPRNYIAQQYQNAPIVTTGECANILTRCMIIFGQGLIQAHPFLYEELKLVNDTDSAEKLAKFDQILMQHIKNALSNIARSFWFSITQIQWSKNRYIQQLNRASSAFSFIVDAYLIKFGNKLKIKEKISARLGDLLSMLYLASCVLKRYEDEGRPLEDKHLVEWAMQDILSTFWNQMDDLLSNYPKFWVGSLLRLIVMPFGKCVRKPNDLLDHRVAQILITPNPSRERLTKGAYLTPEINNRVGLLDMALQKILASENENASEIQKEEAEEIRNEIVAIDCFETTAP